MRCSHAVASHDATRMRLTKIFFFFFFFFTGFNGTVCKMQGTRFRDAGLAGAFQEIMEFATD